MYEYQLNNAEILLGNLNDYRDYIYVDDAVSALSLLNNTVLPLENNIYNIGTSKPNCVNDILKAIEKSTNKKLNIKTENSRMRFDENVSEISDIKKIMKLGWEPKFSLEQGLKICTENFKNKKK